MFLTSSRASVALTSLHLLKLIHNLLESIILFRIEMLFQNVNEYPEELVERVNLFPDFH